MKKGLSIFLIFVMMLGSTTVFADGNKPSENEKIYDVFSYSYGQFVNLDNIKSKEFPKELYDKARKELMNMGITSYWSDHILQQVAGIEGDNIGKAIADRLPGSFVYGDAVEDIINEIFNMGSYKNLDLTKVSIEADNKIGGFSGEYKIPVNSKTPFKGNILLKMSYNIVSGPRDNVSVEVGYTTIDGTYIPIDQESILKYKIDNNTFYEMPINDVDSKKIKDITVKLSNDFNLPGQPSKVLADGIKNGLNNLSKFTPISNKAHEDIESMLEDMGLNEYLGNGDYGKIIAEQLIERLPYIGTAISIAGLSDNIASVINEIIGTDDVISKAEISNISMTVTELADLFSPFGNIIDFEDKNARDKDIKEFLIYSYENNTDFSPQIIGGSSNDTKIENMLCISDRFKAVGPKAIMKNSYSSDSEYSADVYIANYDNVNSYDDAGLFLRANDFEIGEAALKGYYFAVSEENDNAMIGYFDNTFHQLASAPINIENGKWYKIKAKAVGEELSFYVNDMNKPLLTIKDSRYKSGYAGMRYYSSDGMKFTFWDKLFINKLGLSSPLASQEPFAVAAVAYNGNDLKLEAEVDIDGDGKSDTISWEYNGVVIVKVDNYSYYDFNMENPFASKTKFWIIDIDPKDKYKEIVVDMKGSNGNENGHFLVLSNQNQPYLLKSAPAAFEKIVSFGGGRITVVENGKTKQYELIEGHVYKELE